MRRQNSIWSADDDLLALATTIVTLAPAQQTAANQIISAMAAGDVCLLQTAPGMGKTTILRWLRARIGGAFLAARQFSLLIGKRDAPPTGIVFVDDLHLVTPGSAIHAAIKTHATSKWVFALSGRHTASAIPARVTTHVMKQFRPADYSRICRRYLGAAARHLDMAAIHRAAPGLTCYQLKHACLWLGLRYADPTTEAFLECPQVGACHKLPA